MTRHRLWKNSLIHITVLITKRGGVPRPAQDHRTGMWHSVLHPKKASLGLGVIFKIILETAENTSEDSRVRDSAETRPGLSGPFRTHVLEGA